MTSGAARPSILFVDDDPLILQGLQRMLRPLRESWEMTFVESGASALELLAERSVQVVVSDMRMPGMNGAQFLLEVKKRHPKTVRLILSGHADKDLIMQCVGTAHQFLAKPCEPEAIRAAISRATAFDASNKNDKIKSLVAQMDNLPSIPSIYTEIVEKLRDDDCSVQELGDLIVKDLAITAKLLKLVNSAFFGLRTQISSPSEAVSYLGVETIKALVLGVNAFGSFENIKSPAVSLEQVWTHSLAVGGLARKIIDSESVPRVFSDESFIAGMLHDLGKLALCSNLPGEYESAVELAAREKIPAFMAEEQIFGANHADVGGSILSLWGLPVRVVEAIAHHHDPEGGIPIGLNPLIAVHAANGLLHSKTSVDYARHTLRSEFLGSIGLEGKLAAWSELI